MSDPYALVPATNAKGRRIQGLYRRSGRLYLRTTIAGKAYLRAVPYDNIPAALRWCRDFLRSARAGRAEAIEASKARTSYPTLGRVFSAYQSAALQQRAATGRPTDRTVRQTIAQTRNLIGQVLGTSAAADDRCVSVLTRDLVRRYVEQTVATAGVDPEMQERRRVTAASTARQARGLWTKWATEYYDAQSFVLPDIKGYMRATGSFRPSKYVHPPQELIDRTMRAAEALRSQRSDLWPVWVLCYEMGMRAGEAAAAEWSWFERSGDHWEIVVRRRPNWKGPKNQTAHRIPLSSERFSELRTWERSGDSFILAGSSPSIRYKLITERLATWMRGVGWDRRTYPKAGHELRKLAGCMWSTHAGAEWAAAWLGDSIQTVWHYYADMLGQRAPVAMMQAPTSPRSVDCGSGSGI